MIYAEMAGRCGNQFFHYACARYIQIKTEDKDLVLNFNHIFENQKKDSSFYDVLKDFNVVSYKYYERSGTVLKNETNIFQKILVGIKYVHMMMYNKRSRNEKAMRADTFQKLLNYGGVYWIREGVTKVYPTKRKKSIVTGVCESGNVFAEIREQLMMELSPVNSVLDKNVELLSQIEATNSVCVSVRRGDFFDPQNAKTFAVCTPAYYKRAKEELDRRIENPVYFIFSDDIAWCKENIRFEGEAQYVSQDMPVYETLRLMYSCKHFIVSNSTFSWWGQYLSRNENKIVVSPSKWNNDGYESVLIDDSWVLIDV